MDFSELLTTKEVALFFDVSPQTITLWRDHKGLSCIRISGDHRDTIRYDRKTVEKWASKNDKIMKTF